MSFFSERQPIPVSNEFELVDGTLGKLLSNSPDSKKGILREYEFGIYMSVNVAKSLITLLQAKIDETDQYFKKPETDVKK